MVAIERDDYDGWVALLADPIRAKPAYWHLVMSGAAALPAVRRGLQAASGDIRRYCAKALDRLVDDAAYGELVGLVDDPDPRVRWDALHALACDRCKDNVCRPDAETVLPRVLSVLASDPSPHVRAIACEVLGRWAHSDDVVAEALVAARLDDPSPAVRKKAGWYAPGGTIFERTLPKRR